MGDGALGGRFAGCALRVRMNPLMVAGRIGKTRDLLLRDRQPITYRQFLADVIFELDDALEASRYHVILKIARRSSSDDMNHSDGAMLWQRVRMARSRPSAIPAASCIQGLRRRISTAQFRQYL